MADEIQITSNLVINQSNLKYRSATNAYRADMAGAKGPSPGAITATVDGTEVDFSELTTPGICEIINIDETNYVEYGIWDAGASIFYPLGELLPGESYIIRLSKNIQEEYAGTGTGTSASDNKLMFKANTASVVVVVNAFEV